MKLESEVIKHQTEDSKNGQKAHRGTDYQRPEGIGNRGKRWSFAASMGSAKGRFITGKDKYGGMTTSEMRRLRALEEENRRLKQIVADQALDIRALKEINSKNW